MALTLTQLRYLIAIVDARLNISRAAERVHTTQPAMSKQLRAMEDDLGLQIFVRKGKSLDRLTETGEDVVRRARLIASEASQIQKLAINQRTQEAGELRIATTHTQASFVLPDAIAWLRQRYPDVAVHLLPSDQETLVDLVSRGEVDLSMVSSVAPPRGEIAVPAFSWRRVLLVPRTHPLASIDGALSIADIAQYPLVTYESTRKANSSLRVAFENEGFRPTLACTARDADLIKTYVRAGLGVGILAEMAVRPDDLGDLVCIAIDPLLPALITWMVIRRDQVLRDFALQFIARMAPHIDIRDVRAARDGEIVDWGQPPDWAAWSQTRSLQL